MDDTEYEFSNGTMSDMALYTGQAMDIDSTTGAGMEAKSAARSCTTCSKAKAKCVKLPGQHVCERCSRLGKECHSREPVVRRRKVVKTTRTAQLEKLENKIEHLVNALSTSQAQRGLSIDYGQPSPPISNASERSQYSRQSEATDRQTEVLNSLCHGEPPRECYDSPRSSTTATPPVPQSTISTSDNQLTPPSAADYQSLGVSLLEADVLLDRYRRLMAHSMPFVVVPPKATAQQLFVGRPVLLHAICVVTHFHDSPKQQLMVKEMMRDISERMLMNNEKTVDLLQGILVFVAWYHPHIFSSQQATNLLHLAMAMSVDLGIDRPPQQCGDFKSATTKAVHGPNLSARIPTLEEHRALAGTYYLTSMLASSFKKIEAMPASKYLTEALNTIERADEHASDRELVQLCRLAHVIDDICRTQTPDAPMQMYVKAFNVDIQRLRDNDPCKGDKSIALTLQYLVAQILVWEMSLNDLQENKATPLRYHMEHLYQLVKAIRSFIDAYFTIPASDYLMTPFSTFGQYAHGFITLVKLASLDVDGWDMKDLEQQLSFSKTIDEAADRFDASTKSQPDGMTVNNEGFNKWAHRMRWMKQIYESKFIQDGDKSGDRQEATNTLFTKPTESYSAAATPATQQQQPTPPDDILSGDFFNYLDENFWQGFAGDFDLGFPDMTTMT